MLHAPCHFLHTQGIFLFKGWAIGSVILDLVGGVSSSVQLVLDAAIQNNWSGITGVRLMNDVSDYFFLSSNMFLFLLTFFIIIEHCKSVSPKTHISRGL
jgi:hypothetical protein